MLTWCGWVSEGKKCLPSHAHECVVSLVHGSTVHFFVNSFVFFQFFDSLLAVHLFLVGGGVFVVVCLFFLERE